MVGMPASVHIPKKKMTILLRCDAGVYRRNTFRIRSCESSAGSITLKTSEYASRTRPDKIVRYSSSVLV